MLKLIIQVFLNLCQLVAQSGVTFYFVGKKTVTMQRRVAQPTLPE